MKYETILGEVVEVEEPKREKLNAHDWTFLSVATMILMLIIPMVIAIITPKIFGENKVVWVDNAGTMYEYEETVEPEELSVMENGVLTTVANKQHIRYVLNADGENVVVKAVTLYSVEPITLFIISVITIALCLIVAVTLRFALLNKRELKEVQAMSDASNSDHNTQSDIQ